mgnify:FL=1
MKHSTKIIFQVVIYLLLAITMLSSLSFVLLDLNIEQSKLCLKILGVSSILNIFIWLYYELKNAPQIEDHE